MIINNEAYNNELIGDIVEYKASIDVEDLNFITTLLSSNLYSNPEESFLREIVSNAWDSQVVAGTTDIPILVSINENNSVTIRDFGTGLSKEEFQNIYTKIGKSTKRESNDYIGSFGIGKLSPLACSNTACITSYYNNRKFTYILVKNGNNITFNLVEEEDTTEKNGLSVNITVKDIDKLIPCLQVLTFFPNIYIEYTGDKSYIKREVNGINNTKIKKYKNFIACTRSFEMTKILVGNIPYKLTTDIINNNFSNTEKEALIKTSRAGIVLNFNIGDFDVTPNREDLIFTQESLQKIKDKLNKATIEIDEIITPYQTINCSVEDIIQDVPNRNQYYNFVTCEIHDSTNKEMISYDYYINNVTFLYKNNTFEKHFLWFIRNYTIPNEFIINGGYIYNKGRYYWGISKIYSEEPVVQCSSKYTPKVKEYLKSKFRKATCVSSTFNKAVFLNTIYDVMYKTEFKKKDSIYATMLNDIWENIKSRIVYLDVKIDPDYLTWKEENKTTKKSTSKDIDTLIIHNRNANGHLKYQDYIYSIEGFKDFISKRGYKKIVIDDLESFSEYGEYLHLACRYIGIDYCAVSKTSLKKLNEMDLSFRISKDVIYKSKKLQHLCDKKYIMSYHNSIIDNIKIPEYYKDFYKKLCEIPKMCYEYTYNALEHLNYSPSKEAISLRLLCQDTLKKYNDARVELGIGEYDHSYYKDLVYYYLIKNKIVHLNYNIYYHIKNNKIIQNLCR